MPSYTSVGLLQSTGTNHVKALIWYVDRTSRLRLHACRRNSDESSCIRGRGRPGWIGAFKRRRTGCANRGHRDWRDPDVDTSREGREVPDFPEAWKLPNPGKSRGGRISGSKLFV